MGLRERGSRNGNVNGNLNVKSGELLEALSFDFVDAFRFPASQRVVDFKWISVVVFSVVYKSSSC